MIKSIYIHIPFCRLICSYCDFPKMYYNEQLVSKYLEALAKEIKTRYKGEVIDTLYIGGGTPSALSIKNLKQLFKILAIIKLNNIYEYTIEVNQEDIGSEKLQLFKANRINRLSIGIQTFNKNYLKFLNRDEGNFTNKIKLAKKYFTNINVDLIYGLPSQTLKELAKDLDKVLKLDIPHLSLYSLMIEEHTKLYIDKVKNIDEDLDNRMFYYIKKRLKTNQYHHYEISNYAKEGYESKHNLTYWNNEHYYGFGLGASGYVNNIRYTNTKNINKYLLGNTDETKEILRTKDIISYELILGLRKRAGINLLTFKNKYKKDLQTIFSIQDLLDQGLLIIQNKQLFINSKYLYIANEILERFV